MPPCFAGAKRPLEMVLYDPAAAAAAKRARQEEAATTSSASSATTSEPALVVLDVKPISAIPPPRRRRPPRPRAPRLPPLAAAAREAPACLRGHFLAWLGLRGDVPVHFIDEKILTDTDLNPHQNRFRIPRDGVMNRLLPILTPAEIVLANLRDDKPRSPRSNPKKKKLLEPQNGEGNCVPGKKVKKPKAKGKVHGGLRVKLVDLMAGAKELLMAKWSSSRGTVVKGEGYLDFIRRCSFKENDAVEIWAFVQRRVRIFGSDLCDASLLHVLVVKKDQLPTRCRCCPPPPPAVNPSTNLVMP